MHVGWTCCLPGGESDAFDAFVLRSASGHARQTSRWAAVACAGAPVVARFVTVRDGSALLATAVVLRPCVGGVPLPWAWVERGPVVDDPSRLGPCLRAIEQTARARGVLRLRVMPYWAAGAAEQAERALRAGGYRDVQGPSGAHARTLRLDLSGKASSELLAGPALAQVRWRASQARKLGAHGRRGTAADWARMRSMHSAMMAAQGRQDRGGAWWSALEAFASDETRGGLFVCEWQGRVVSACVVLRHAGHVTYGWGASVLERLPFTKAIPPLLASMVWAHAAGCTVFDLGGIPLEGDRDPKRNAIATFKHDFGRVPVRLVHEHARWLVP